MVKEKIKSNPPYDNSIVFIRQHSVFTYLFQDFLIQRRQIRAGGETGIRARLRT